MTILYVPSVSLAAALAQISCSGSGNWYEVQAQRSTTTFARQLFMHACTQSCPTSTGGMKSIRCNYLSLACIEYL